MRRFGWTVVICLAGILPVAAQQAAPDIHAPVLTALDLNTIVDRVEQAQEENRARFRAYVVTRDYKLFSNNGEKLDSSVRAALSFTPPNRKAYKILSSSGSGRGERIVRKVLDKETEMTRDMGDTGVSRRNYDFQFVRTDTLHAVPVYVLQLQPKRADKGLIRGLAFVDANTFFIHRIAGRPAKMPSWWIKDVQIALDFSDVKGMWLQTGSEAVANVRFFGKHNFTARDVAYRTADVVARTASPAAKPAMLRTARPQRPSPVSAIGAGIVLER